MSFAFSPTSFTYNGGAQGPAIAPSDGNASFSTDGTTSAVDAGTYSVTATATGYYTGSGSTTWTIAPEPVSFSISPTSFTYNGSAQGPAIAPSDGNASFSTSETTSAVAAGSYSVTATATGDYTGSGSTAWTIAPKPVSFTISPTSFTYNGSAQSPVITPSVSGATYSTSGTASATAAGSYSVTVTATGNYTGSGSTAWTIAKATPLVSNWPNRAIPNNTGYTVLLADLNAVFSNPYNSSAAPPTGAVVYSVVSCSSGAVAAGTVITAGTVLPPATYTIRTSYPGDANYNAITANATWVIANPVSLTQTSAASSNVFGTSVISIAFGQTATVMGISSDKDSLLVSQTIDYQLPNSNTWVNSGMTWNGGPTASDTLTWTIPVSTLGNNFGTWQVRAWAANNVPFTSLNTTNIVSINYTKATPVVSNWASQTFTFSGNTYTVPAANLGAVFSNPYNSSVTQPTGTVTYTVFPDTSNSVTAGTKLLPGTYTIRAYYPGDANYNATTADATWTINNFVNPNADSTGDGIPNSQKTTNTYTTAANNVGMTVPGGWPLLAAADPNNSHAVGQTAGSLSVDKSGAATYTIPLYACPGTGGMEPSLSLMYSSSAGAGVAGFGWSLGGISSITRGAQTATIDGNGSAVDANGNSTYVHGMNFAMTDRYYLDGQRLIAINGGADGANGTEYRTEMDSFSRIVSYGSNGNGPAYFVVWTKSGKIMEYGHTSDSAFTPDDANGNTLGTTMSWAVDKVSDTVGNYMTFTYSTNTSMGEQHLAEIDYTGNTAAGVQPYNSVKFVYTTRQDPSSGYVRGARIASTQILTDIEACTGIGSGASIIHRYHLDYTNRSYTKRSILNDVQEIGSDGKAYPPLTFTYSDPSPPYWTQSSTWAPPAPLAVYNSPPQGAGFSFIDLDGDGRPDFVQGTSVWLNTLSGWVAASNWNLPSSCNLTYPAPHLVDLTGNGLPDLVAPELYGTGHNSFAYLNTGSGWGALDTTWEVPAMPPDLDSQLAQGLVAAYQDPNNLSFWTMARSDVEFIDVNGDGLPDCLCYTVVQTYLWDSNGTSTHAGPVIVVSDAWINLGPGPNQIDPQTGTHWHYAPQYALPFPTTQRGAAFIDLNGDGLPDEMEYSLNQSGGPSIGVALNTGQGWNIINPNSDPQDFNRYAPPCPFNFFSYVNGTFMVGAQLADLTGDGLTDIIARNDTTNAAYFNTGNGWAQAPSSYQAPVELGTGTNGNTPNGVALLDIDGGDMTDIVYNYGSNAPGVWLNPGSGWLNTGTGWVSTNGEYNIPWELGDANTATTGSGADFIDINGDGGRDEVWNWQDQNGNITKGAAINQRTNVDRLTTVTTGMGISASIKYEPLTDRDPATGNFTVYTKGTGAVYPQTDLIAPMYVVSEVDTDDGTFTAGSPKQYAMTYHYTGWRSDALHGDLGFASMTVTDGRTQIGTTTNYRQDYPFIGMALSTATTQAGGAVLTASATTWADIPATYTSNNGLTLTTHVPYASQVLQQTYDLNGAFLSSTSTTSANYDNYGNAGTVDVKSLTAPSNPNDYSDPNSYGSPTGYEKSTTNTYTNIVAPAPGNWFLGQLGSVQTTSSAPATPSITHIANFKSYDPVSGLLVQQIAEPSDPLSLTTTYTYDSFGNINSVTTSGAGLSNRTVATTYDSHGQFPVKTTNALNQSETYTYDPRFGVMTSETGPNGLMTTWNYDGMGRKIQETRPDGTVTEINYRWASANSALTSINAPAGPTYLIETETSGAPPSLAFYDNMGRAIYTFGLNGGDFDGNPRIVGSQTQFDSMGRAYWTSLPFYYLDTPRVGTQVPEVPTDPTNPANQYDALSRPLEVQTTDDEAPGGFVNSTFVYNGLVTTTTNPSGQATVTTKNSEGQVLSVVTNATGAAATDIGETSYNYDADGNVLSTSVVNSNSPGSPVTTYYTYDLFGRKLTMTDPDRGGWSYTYDAAGELISQTDAKGQTVTMAYEVLGRLVTRTEPEGTTTWTYDTAANGVGEVASIAVVSTTAANNYSEFYTYDSLGRPITTTRNIYTGSRTETFTNGQQYDAFGRPTIGTYPGDYQVQNVYNAFGFLNEVSEANDPVQNQVFWQADSYSLWGGVNGCTYGNGVTEDTIVAATTGRVLGFGIGVNEGVAFYTYIHDALGNITNRNDAATGRNETYFYDGLNRLTKRTLTVNDQAAPDQTVAYDSLGNITNKSDVGAYTYGGLNGDGTHAGPHAVTGAGGNSYGYDADGNMVSGSVIVSGAPVARTIAWTSFNQAQTITQGSHSSAFTFDADHQRVTQTTDQGVNTVYVGSAFERVTNGSDVQYKYYIFTPAGRSVVRTLDAGTVTTRYLHQDVLGSIVAVTDETGAVAERYAYDPWGKQSTLLPPASGLSPATSRGFTDHEMLPELGLIHMNGRVYDPVLGRFLSADSVVQDPGDSQAYNRFSYCSNNPVNAFDPSGHSWFSSFLHFLRKATRDMLIGPFPHLNPLSGPISRLYQWGESHQQELEIAAIIVLSIYTGGLAYEAVYGDLGGYGAMTIGAGNIAAGQLCTVTITAPSLVTSFDAAVVAGAAGGATGGFVSGVGMESMNGGSIGQDLKAGLKGAEYGAISGAITAGMGNLNDGILKVTPLESPFTVRGLEDDGWDLARVAGQGGEGALKNELENKNASTGFWSGAFGAVGGVFKDDGFDSATFKDDLATGVLGGLSSMTKAGKGFGPGFWNAEAGAVGGQIVGQLAGKIAWLKGVYGSVESGLAGGLKSKLGGTAVSAGARTALYTSLASYGIDGIESSLPGYDKPDWTGSKSAVTAGYSLVQPKTSTHKGKTTTTIPLNSVKGGTWANAAPWAQLYPK
ncbi:MAG TPA: RHS repeat-associated core domain-containing protein [Opitutaceae bacterium]|nr:RHS repeat-associated core domain-containing protein [Opitutaceae bacterium]